MLYCKLNDVFCNLIEIADGYVIVSANGYTYRSTMESLLVL